VVARIRTRHISKHLLNRREFNGLWVTIGSSLSSVGAMIVALSSAPARAATAAVKLPDGTTVPALGQGSAGLAQGRHPEAAEQEALRTGLSLGMTLIDTAEIYGDGRSEKLIGEVIAGQRDRVFLVSKVWPTHVAGNGIARACEASLARLGTDHLDLYLLHWPSRDADLSSIGRRSKRYARRGRFARGAYPTSRSVTWKTSSVLHTVIAARPIRSRTTSAIAVSSMTCCHGASSTACR